MIDLFEAVGRIQRWLDDFLSVNNAAFGGLPPCPFAKKAWLDKKVAISNVYDESEIVEHWIDRTFDGTIEVGCIVLDPTAISADELTAMCARLGAARGDFVFLDDQPLTKCGVRAVLSISPFSRRSTKSPIPNLMAGFLR